MGAGPDERQQQDRLALLIDQQPVGVDMTFAFARSMAGERVVAAVLRQRSIGPEHFHHVEQSPDVPALLQHELDVLFELRGTFDIVVHESRSLRSSSTDLKTLPTPGFLSSSASRRA